MDIAEFEKRLRERDLEGLERFRRGTGPPPTIYKASGRLLVPQEAGDGMVFVASDESPDRMGDVIEAGGWELGPFERNPVFMFAHDYRTLPIGTVPKVWVEPDAKQLRNTVKFDLEDEFAAAVSGKYARGVMRAESVGFRPLEFEFLDTDAGPFGPVKFHKQELLEISAVPVPAHPEALRKAMDGTFRILVPVIPAHAEQPAQGDIEVGLRLINVALDAVMNRKE